MWQAMGISDPGAEALGFAEDAGQAMAGIPLPEEDRREAKPRWAKRATRSAIFAPEQFRPGVRLEHKIRRCKAFAAH